MNTTSTSNTTNYGFIRIASAIPQVSVADVQYNMQGIINGISKAEAINAQIVVFPELSVTGYTCADLFGNDLLLDKAEQAVDAIVKATTGKNIVVIFGAPLRGMGKLYNCAVVAQGGKMWVVPKTYIPNYKEFYEKRWFASATAAENLTCINVAGINQPFGRNMLFHVGKAVISIEICEDLWVPIPPSSIAALNGANVICNVSASNELIGKHQFLLNLIKHQSNQSIAAYVYSSAGYGESTTDLVFAGNAIIAENGSLLAESKRFNRAEQLVYADVDLEALENERRVNVSFADNLHAHKQNFTHVFLNSNLLNYDKHNLARPIKRLPFVPSNDAQLTSRCEEIINIQAEGLMRRLEFTHIKKVVLGISGGLDSTLALLVAVEAFNRLGWDLKGIHGITMPGFGTTGRTHSNATKLMQALGITIQEIPIADAVMQHFKDIGQDINVHDVTYENSQARERTQILMDYANKINALVMGTGDLSELALGWATYNGDHISMYNVNSSIPKTLVEHLVGWFAMQCKPNNEKGKTINETLVDILNTPISPELIPSDAKGTIVQKTEEFVGPYELNDFFLYYMLRYGFSPRKIYRLAKDAFGNDYDNATIIRWLTNFCKRFFSQQFKRSCMPDGPKVGSISLSPRGDWRMPSDASSALWLDECNTLKA